ncbi:hypothetical protein D3C71_24970 [compost metagenome]
MYKNPELTCQARILARELSSLGVEMSHAKSLEMLARIQGARTLHVLQAANEAVKRTDDLVALANRQAAAVAFEGLGRFCGNVDGLLESIETAVSLEGTQGSRGVEAAMHGIFGQADSPKLSAAFEHLRIEDVPERYRALRAQLLETLVDATGTKGGPGGLSAPEKTLYVGPMMDWRLQEGEDTAKSVPPEQRTAYEVKVAKNGYQLYVDIAPVGADVDDLAGRPQLSLFIEVNEGKPCVHMSNDIHGDQVLSVFAASAGLYLRPDSSEARFEAAVNGRGDFKGLFATLTAGMPARATANHLVISADNS